MTKLPMREQLRPQPVDHATILKRLIALMPDTRPLVRSDRDLIADPRS